ncbi:hypothetical protein EYC59_02910 [Candidatus Saccharibacteria bacterium]|nr:MAG: hypothetical protein EYC59_02910 [Candidatus Saccharibacteria bacterium]
MILVIIFIVIFAVVLGVTWAGFKIAAPHKPANRRKILTITAIVSVVLMACLMVYLANGFSSLPNQQ